MIPGALPQTQQAYANLSSALVSRGISITVAPYGGVRTEADTNEILQFRQNDYNHDHGLPADTVTDVDTLNAYRPIAPYGESFHNYGAAFDILITGRPSGMTLEGAYSVAGSVAPSVGLRWGGTFPNPDIRHFELDESLADASSQYSAMTGGAQLPPNIAGFSLPSFLPGTTFDAGTLPDLSDLPGIEMIGMSNEADDSGEASGFLDDAAGIPQADQAMLQQVGLFALAGVALGVVVWAVRRKFSRNLPSFFHDEPAFGD